MVRKQKLPQKWHLFTVWYCIAPLLMYIPKIVNELVNSELSCKKDYLLFRINNHSWELSFYPQTDYSNKTLFALFYVINSPKIKDIAYMLYPSRVGFY